MHFSFTGIEHEANEENTGMIGDETEGSFQDLRCLILAYTQGKIHLCFIMKNRLF